MDWNVLESSVGGFEVYAFIADHVVNSKTVPARAAWSLRMVSRDFRDAVDDAILEYMPTVNEMIKSLSDACTRLKRISVARVSSQDPSFHEWHLSYIDSEQRVNFATERLESKFGHNVAFSIRKCIKITAEMTSTFRGRDITSAPNIELTPAHVHNSVRSFLMMCNDNVCEMCQFHDPFGEKPLNCASSDCGGETFWFVPGGKGLMMRCSEFCMTRKCVTINCRASSNFIQRIAAYNHPESRQRKTLEALLVHAGYDEPFSRDMMERRFDADMYKRHVKDATAALNLRRNDAFPGIRMLMLETPATVDESIPTMQSILKIKQPLIEITKSTLQEADAVQKEMDRYFKTLISKLVENQFLDLLYAYMCDKGSEEGPVNSIQYIEERLPGSKRFVEYVFAKPLSKKTMRDLHKINIRSVRCCYQFVHTVACALMDLPKWSTHYYGKPASACANAYVSGLCAGNDAFFDICEIDSQLCHEIRGAGQSSSDPTHTTNMDLATMAYFFDSADFKTIEVHDKTEKKIHDDLKNKLLKYASRETDSVFLVMIKFCDKYISIPLGIDPLHCSAFQQTKRKEAGLGVVKHTVHQKYESALSILSEMGYDVSNFPHVPKLTILGTTTQLDNMCREWNILVNWLSVATRKLAKFPETRAIALDMLTNNDRDLLIRLVAPHTERAREQAAISAAETSQDTFV